MEWNDTGVRIRRGEESSDIISAGSIVKEYDKAVHSYGGVISLDDEYASKLWCRL